MLGGLRAVLARELVTTARRGAIYQTRVVMAAAVVAALVGAIVVTFPDGPGGWEVPAERVRIAAQGAFDAVIMLMALLVAGVPAARSSMSIARERERGTLAKLLTTRLNAFEIVIGKLISALARCFAALAAGVPVLLLLGQLGGADQERVVLAIVGLVTWAFFLSALWLAASVVSRVETQATGLAMTLVSTWLTVPVPLFIVLPRLFPKAAFWVRPLCRALLAGSPTSVLAHVMRIVPGPGLATVVLRMATIQVVLGLALTAWSVAWLRPVSRRLLEGESAAVPGFLPRWWGRRRDGRVRPRPPCGDDPMEWKKRCTSRPGLIARAFVAAVWIILLGVLGFVTWFVARPAWDEAWGTGALPTTEGDARWVFNQLFLRPLFGVFSFVILLMVIGQTVETFDRERKRGTWLLLLATTLTGREILGSRRSLIRRFWGTMGLIPLALGVLGLVLGAVHPLGVLAAVAAWYAALRISTALGAYTAMWAREERTQGWIFVLILLLFIATALVPWAFGRRPELAAIGVISPPFLAVLSLLSGPEVRAILGHGPPCDVRVLCLAGRPGSGAWIAAALILGPVLHLVAARRLERAIDRTFNIVVGRTDRDVEPSPVERAPTHPTSTGKSLGESDPSESNEKYNRA